MALEDLSHLQQRLRDGQTTCVQLVEDCLARTAAQARLNAFLEVYADEAREKARLVDEKLARGTAGPLAGMVLGVKDVIVHRGHRASASSRMLEGFESLFTATALQRVLDADAIALGRQNCDEFAMGSSTENSAFGPSLNPHNLHCVPGGSSGGSASAVAAGLCHASLGTDTGGSVRQPAAFCGIVGIKPTYGRVSRSGMIAYASSFDQMGPMTRSVADAARLLQVMAGKDPRDNTSSPAPVPNYLEHLNAQRPLTIGVLEPALNAEGLDPEIRQRTLEVLESLKAAGHRVVNVDFAYLDYLVPAYYVLTTAEASSNLARYDGVRYGYRAAGVSSPEELYRHSRSQGFGPEVKRRIVLGTFVLSTGYFDAYYTQAQKVRRLIADASLKLLQQCDVLASPTTPTTAFEVGAKATDNIAMYLSDIFTVQAPLAGLPAISVPMGLHSNGLPMGFHLTGRPFDEASLFQVAHDVELRYSTPLPVAHA